MIIFKHEYTLKWRDLYKIRISLEGRLKKLKFSRQLADPIIIILSELVENAFKYSDKKKVTIILKYASPAKEHILVKLHHPVADFKATNVKILLADISKINAAQDVNQIFLDSLREATIMNAKANQFRLALVRKTAGGGHLHVKKSLLYKPGISLAIQLAVK